MKTWWTFMAISTLSQGAGAAETTPLPLAEVIVTARRVPEAASRLPLAVDVVQADRIAAGGVIDMNSLAMQLPGLNFESLWGGSLAAPVLRGQSQPSTAGDNVGVFVDDIYQAGRASIDVAMLDLERVEVLRGPQNTQFGRSTFAGAIRYVPQQPTAELTRRVSLEYGSDSLAGLQAVASRRIFGTPWLGRIAIGHREGDGTEHSGNASLEDFRRNSVALTLAHETAGAAARPVVLSLRYQQGRHGHPASSTLNATDYNCGARDPASGLWSYFCGAVPTATDFSLTPDLPDSRVRSAQVSLRMEKSLGEIKLRSLTGYYESSATIFRDFDGSAEGLISGVCTVGFNCLSSSPASTVTRFASPNVISRPKSLASDWSQELRLGQEDSPGLRWMIGLAASRTRIESSGAFGVDREDLLPNERLTTLVASSLSRVGSQSLMNSALVEDSRLQQILQSESRDYSRVAAAFGMIDLPLASISRLRLELRAEREEIRTRSLRANFQPNTLPDPEPVRLDVLLPRISIDLQPGERWYLYSSLARGARSGGINTLPGLIEEERAVEPEFNWTSELGLRFQGASWFQGFQTTLYRIDWKNTQIIGVSASPGVNNLITSNTAGLTTLGIESQLMLRLGDRMMGSLAFSQTDPRFDTGSDDAGSRAFCGLTVSPPSSTFCAFGPPRTVSNGSLRLVPWLDDNLAARAPRRSLNVGFQFRPQITALGWRIRGETAYAWQEEVFERPINGASYGARGLLSARAIFEKDEWRAELWGSNLADERFVRTASSRGGAFYPSLPRPLDLLYGEGRRVGLNVALDLPSR